METYNNLPLFYMDINSDENGVQAVSLVDCPAIEEMFIHFSKEDKDMEVKFSVDNEKHLVSGPVLIPDQKIYRVDEEGNPFYITFTKEAIERIALKFFYDHNNTNGNIQHEVDVNGIAFFESFIINRDRNILPVEFSHLPDGTWIVTAKIFNEAVWELVKTGVLRGFSIQGFLHVVTEEEKAIETIEDLLDYITEN